MPGVDAMIMNDPVLRALTAHASSMVKLAGLKAAAHLAEPDSVPLPANADALERLFHAELSARDPAAQQRAIRNAVTVFARGSGQFGALRTLDLRSTTPMLLQAKSFVRPTGINAAWAEKVTTSLVGTGEQEPDAPAARGDVAAGGVLQLRVREIVCVAETGALGERGEEEEEIAVGGVAIDEFGNVVKGAEIGLGSFRDKRRRVLDPPRVFSMFDVAGGGERWPKFYSALITLVDKNNGGLPGFLSDLFKQVKGWLTEVLGAAVGPVAGSVVPALVSVVAALVGSLIDELCGWVVDLCEDDVHPARNIGVRLLSRQHVFANGTQTCGVKVATILGHHAKYRVFYDWHLRA